MVLPFPEPNSLRRPFPLIARRLRLAHLAQIHTRFPTLIFRRITQLRHRANLHSHPPPSTDRSIITTTCHHLSLIAKTNLATGRIVIIRRISFPLPNPEAQATFRATPPSGSFDASEQGSLNSSPRSSTLSPIPPIETIPSQTRLGVSRTRNNSPAKMHICPVCNKEFPRPSGLKTHMNIHNNLRPYTCGFPNCPKTFSVRSNARRHYRIHSGTGPPEPPVQEFRVDFREPEVHRQVTPPPFSLSQAPFRLRWVRPNINSRTAAGANTPLSDSGWGAQEGGNDAQDPEDRAHESMSAYDATDDTDDMYYDNQRSWDAHARSRYPGA
ncbi:hypothetical protein DFH09DRAFT_278077 [Mycena vulgaris]|nr:hypothetical protein DFH09DRAFT_278077 [Mycena vulgaris]